MADSSHCDRVIEACSAQPGAVEDYPFGDELLGLIEHSYELVVSRLPRAQRDNLGA
jgi:predicted DNA-binding protein (MmcQ/YjbR family)